MQKTKSVQPLSVVGKRLELEENSNPVQMRKSFDDSFHARNYGRTMAGGYADQTGQNNARFEGKKVNIFVHFPTHHFCTVCPDTSKLSVGQMRS